MPSQIEPLPDRVTASQLCGSRIAGCNLTRGEAAAKPATALLCRSVGPGLRMDAPAAPSLDAIVADRGRSAERLLDVPRLEQLALRGRMGPDPREAVGLKLDPHGRTLGSSARPPPCPLQRVDLEHMLDVMANLV